MRQSFSYSLLITWILLSVSCKTEFIQKSYSTQNISVTGTSIQPDKEVLAVYNPFKKELEKDMNRVISVSNKEMVKRIPESALTNLLADLLLEEGITNCVDSNFGIIPDIAIQNYGSIRTPLPEGNITVGNIFELMPFENELVYVKLSGKQVAELIDFLIVEKEWCISGMRIKVNNNKATDIRIGNKLLNPEDFYWIITSEFVADGGDDFVIFNERLDIKHSGIKIRDAIISNFEKRNKKGELLNVIPDGRVIYE